MSGFDTKVCKCKGYDMAGSFGYRESNASKSTLISKNITVLGRRTSVRLEPEMWTSLREIAKREDCKIHDLCSLVQLRKNPDTSLTAAIRVFLMLYFRAAATEEGHSKAGHGSFSNMLHGARMTCDMLMTFKKSPSDREKISSYNNGVYYSQKLKNSIESISSL